MAVLLYDLTYSSGPNGEQSTMVMGEGRFPDQSHLRKAGTEAGLKKAIIDYVFDQTWSALSEWQDQANNYGVSSISIQQIETRLQTV